MSDLLDDILGSEAINTLSVEASDDEIRRIADLANKQLSLQQQVADLEEQMKAAKEELRVVQEHDLPDAMAEAGISEVKLADGSRVKTEPFVNASITKAKADKAHAWLVENGHGDLIKREVIAKFGRGDDKFEKARLALLEHGIAAETKEAVHHMTLKGFAREQIEQGKDLPVDLFNLYSGSKATIAK